MCRNVSINYFLFPVAGQIKTTDRRYVQFYSVRSCVLCTGFTVGKKMQK